MNGLRPRRTLPWLARWRQRETTSEATIEQRVAAYLADPQPDGLGQLQSGLLRALLEILPPGAKKQDAAFVLDCVERFILPADAVRAWFERPPTKFYCESAGVTFTVAATSPDHAATKFCQHFRNRRRKLGELVYVGETGGADARWIFEQMEQEQ